MLQRISQRNIRPKMRCTITWKGSMQIQPCSPPKSAFPGGGVLSSRCKSGCTTPCLWPMTRQTKTHLECGPLRPPFFVFAPYLSDSPPTSSVCSLHLPKQSSLGLMLSQTRWPGCHMSCSPGLHLHAPVCPVPIHPLFLSLIIVSSDNPALLSLTRPKSPAVVSQNHVLSLGLFSQLWFYLCIYMAIWWPHPLNDKLHGVHRPYILCSSVNTQHLTLPEI